MVGICFEYLIRDWLFGHALVLDDIGSVWADGITLGIMTWSQCRIIVSAGV